MAQEKKDTSAVTVSLTNNSIREFDSWRLNQPYSPSRSKIFQKMLDEFLIVKQKEEQEFLEAQESLKHSVIAATAATAATSVNEEKKPKSKAAAVA